MPNDDPRYITTKAILKELNDRLPTKLNKDTRAGATTGLGANAIDAGMRFVLIGPTKEIAHNTIKDSIKYSSKGSAKIKLLISNHACLKNKKMVEKYPDVGKIPILPLPEKCEECKHFYQCPVTDFLRTNIRDIDGVGLTYQKLMAVMLSDSKTAERIKKRLTHAKLYIFDEAHNYETPDVVNIQMYPHHNMSRYQELFKENKKISPFLENFAELKHRLQIHVMELLHAKDDALKNRMAIDLKDIDSIHFKQTVAALKEVIEVMKHRDRFGLSVGDVLFIFNVIMILSTKQLVLHYMKTDDGDSVHLSAKDGLHLSTKLFLSMLNPEKKKKIVFTSATFGDYDYTPIFGFHDQIVMPDVMKSNEKMTIYPDTFKMDDINYSKRYAERIIDAAVEYEKKYPGIRFVCMKKNVAFWLQHRLKEKGYKINIDYYRSDRTIGVSSDERRCVCVGAPTSPINAYDGIVDTFEQSQKRRTDDNHAAFWQAISRFKDPAGVVESHIFCIGIKEEEIKKMIKWGINRKLYMNGIVCERVENDGGFAMPIVFSRKCGRVLKMVKKRNGISHNDLRKRLKISSKELNMVITKLKNDGLIQNNVVNTKGRSKTIYRV